MNEPGPISGPSDTKFSVWPQSPRYLHSFLWFFLPYLPITYTLFTCDYLPDTFLSFEDIINFKEDTLYYCFNMLIIHFSNTQ